MGLKFRFCIVWCCLVVAGCSNNEFVIKKQAETEARLEQLIQGNAATSARLAELTHEMNDAQGQLKATASDLAELKAAYRELRSSREAAPPRVEEKAGQNGPSKIVVVNKGVSPGDRESVEQDAYMKAFGLFSANDYTGAIEAFNRFIQNYPGSEYAGNAQYWIGECYYTQRDFTRALGAFSKVVDTYPKGKKVPDAMLKVGFSLISLNQQDKARVALEALVEKFPKSQAALKAKERLSHK